MQFLSSGQSHTVAKVIYTLMTVAGLIYLLVAYVVVPAAGLGVFERGDFELQIVQVVLALVGILTLLASLRFPMVTAKFMGGLSKSSPDPMTFIIVRASFLEAIGIYGLILALMGAAVFVSLPFILVSLAALILTFPTRERWQKLSGKDDNQPGPVS